MADSPHPKAEGELLADLDFEHPDDAHTVDADKAFNERLKRVAHEREIAPDHITDAEKEAQRKIEH